MGDPATLMLKNSVPVGFYGGMELDVFQFAEYLKNFKGKKLASENSPLYERDYAEAMAYERPLGGERIRFVAARPRGK